jgi:hypothetical protein
VGQGEISIARQRLSDHITDTYVTVEKATFYMRSMPTLLNPTDQPSDMFAAQDKSKPDTENVRGLNLAVVKLTTVQVTKLPLLHKVRKICMICFPKPLFTEDLYVVQNEEFSVTCYMCEIL